MKNHLEQMNELVPELDLKINRLSSLLKFYKFLKNDQSKEKKKSNSNIIFSLILNYQLEEEVIDTKEKNEIYKAFSKEVTSEGNEDKLKSIFTTTYSNIIKLFVELDLGEKTTDYNQRSTGTLQTPISTYTPISYDETIKKLDPFTIMKEDFPNEDSSSIDSFDREMVAKYFPCTLEKEEQLLLMEHNKVHYDLDLVEIGQAFSQAFVTDKIILKQGAKYTNPWFDPMIYLNRNKIILKEILKQTIKNNLVAVNNIGDYIVKKWKDNFNTNPDLKKIVRTKKDLRNALALLINDETDDNLITEIEKWETYKKRNPKDELLIILKMPEKEKTLKKKEEVNG